MDLSRYYEFAMQTAYQAGRLTLGYYQTGLQPDIKSDLSPVTAADRASEQFIRAEIEQRYPHHAIVGEEFGAKEQEGAAFRWFIDPIDGTQSFIHGVPLYAVLLGLEIEGRPAVGAAYFPALDEMLAAGDGLGCWWNGKRARVSQVERLQDATMAFTDPANFIKRDRLGAWERLMRLTRYRTGWSDAYGYLLVATGRIELAIDPVMNAWDCGPFPPILAEAGGYFGDWQGKVSLYGGEAFATTQKLLPQVLEILRNEN
jgi:myo-inositol-1(or 4)-monophosphatase